MINVCEYSKLCWGGNHRPLKRSLVPRGERLAIKRAERHSAKLGSAVGIETSAPTTMNC